MLIDKFCREYLQSPFFYWGIILGGLTVFNASGISVQILMFLFTPWVHFAVFFGSLVITIIIAGYPIRQGLIDYYRDNTKKEGLVIRFLILGAFLIQVPFYFIESKMILAALWPSAVTNMIQFEFAKNLNIMAQFALLPTIQFYIFYIIKSKLEKGKYKTDGKLKDYWKNILYAIIIYIITVIVVTFLSNVFIS